MARSRSSSNNNSTANLGLEANSILQGSLAMERSDMDDHGSPKGEHNQAHQFGVPPRGNANFAWVQHFIHHLAPHGIAGFVLANGSMSSHQSGEGDIRRPLIEADVPHNRRISQ